MVPVWKVGAMAVVERFVPMPMPSGPRGRLKSELSPGSKLKSPKLTLVSKVPLPETRPPKITKLPGLVTVPLLTNTPLAVCMTLLPSEVAKSRPWASIWKRPLFSSPPALVRVASPPMRSSPLLLTVPSLRCSPKPPAPPPAAPSNSKVPWLRTVPMLMSCDRLTAPCGCMRSVPPAATVSCEPGLTCSKPLTVL